MKRFFTSVTLLALFFLLSNAEALPTVSNAGNEVWYLIKFLNGGNTFTAASNGQRITTSIDTGADEQLWKVTGDATAGYSFTNKKGYTLYVSSASSGTAVYASQNPGGTSRFFIKPTTNSDYSGNFEIIPVGNSAISMNLEGGPSENRGVCLWNNGDPNNSVKFVEYEEWKVLKEISIIPYPSQLTVTKKGTLSLSALNAITYTDGEVKKYVDDFAEQLYTASGIKLTAKESGSNAGDGEIFLSTDNSLPNEGYTISVNEKNIEIKAAGKAGFFYAIQTVKQLLPRDYFCDTQNSSANWSVPFVSIIDKPQFEHRGFMLDIVRHFFDKDEVKKVLDIMALYKLNRLHWHLTDDQGWRIEIPQYPLLTEVGSIRSSSFSNPGEGGVAFYDDTEYGRGMWYSQEELIEIVAYAAERNIDIMPEIDLPGHMVAAVTAYPELSCDPTKKYSVRIDGGISKDVLNVGNDKVIEFLKCVIDNVASIFPFPYIHIGGDECPTDQWKTNEDCLRRVQEEGLSGVDQLQSWLVEELGTYIKEKHNKDIVVWDELLGHWNSNNKVKPVIMAWNSIGLSGDAANKGFKSILTPYSHVYIDFMQVPDDQLLVDEPYFGGWGINTLEEVYTLNPVSGLSGREDFCMGVQCNMWTETCNDNIELEYQLLPRLIALSETGWLPVAQKNWMSFYTRLQSHDEILDALGYTYAKHYIEQEILSSEEQNLKDAEEILASSIRGGVGYPEANVYDELENAVKSGKATDISEALQAFKEAEIVQPVPGKTYQIISASTYYKKQFAGSSMYIADDGVRIHYTQQTEPEELWKFEQGNDGFILRNVCSNEVLQMPEYNKAVVMAEKNGTPLRVDKATVPSVPYDYIPGVVTISAVSGYSASATGNIKRINAELSGKIFAKNEAALCYPSTWYIVEVSDFKAQLQGLCDKCERIMLTASSDEAGQPSSEALYFLENSILNPALKEIEKNDVVTEAKYNVYVALYNQYLLMPRTTIIDAISEHYYYYIRNAHPDYASYYATLNTSNNSVEPKLKDNSDNYLWRIVKNNDGTVSIYNKANGESAYINSDIADQKVMVGKEYSWTIEETTVDTGHSGIAIIGANGANAWYTNPNAWGYVLMKPFWGACIWSFDKSNVATGTGIDEIVEEQNDNCTNRTYDLQGRVIEGTAQGIYINGRGEKILVRK